MEKGLSKLPVLMGVAVGMAVGWVSNGCTCYGNMGRAVAEGGREGEREDVYINYNYTLWYART